MSMNTQRKATCVRIADVAKSYGDTVVLRDIDLTVSPGELFFLLGPSGCGKTTLLRVIAGFVDATRGEIYFDDRDMTSVPPHQRNTGMVFQNYALWPHMTVAQNVAFGLDVRGLTRAEKDTRVARALAEVHLPGYENRFPHQLSGGQQQRVALARALVIEPDVVLLDEPLSNLDAGLRIEMRKEIHRIHKELGLTMIYVTHDQKEALSLATRVAVLHEGTLAQVATPAEIYHNPATPFVAQFVGETNMLPGRVQQVSHDDVRVETPAGALCCPLSRATCEVSEGMEVAVSIRPEGITSLSLTSSAAQWQARVHEMTYLGEVVQNVLRIGERLLRQTELNRVAAPPSAGTDMTVHIRAEHVRIFPSNAADVVTENAPGALPTTQG